MKLDMRPMMRRTGARRSRLAMKGVLVRVEGRVSPY
jgi:hypothetical protein